MILGEDLGILVYLCMGRWINVSDCDMQVSNQKKARH